MLKRKEREYEHEMERLAKDKIAKQQQIITLRRELSLHIDNYDSTIMLTDSEIGNSIRERGECQQQKKKKYFTFSLHVSCSTYKLLSFVCTKMT